MPAGFRVVSRTPVAPGVERLALERDKPPLRVNVARIAPNAPVSLRAVLSNDAVGGRDPIVERTSSMCQRVHCLLAVNGDFAGGDEANRSAGCSAAESCCALRARRSCNSRSGRTAASRPGNSAGREPWSPPTWRHSPWPRSIGRQPPMASPSIRRPTARPLRRRGRRRSSASATSSRRAGCSSVRPTMVEIIGLWEQPAGSAPSPIPADGGVLVGRGPAAEILRSLSSRVQTGQVSSRALLRLDTRAGVAREPWRQPDPHPRRRPLVRRRGQRLHPRPSAPDPGGMEQGR